VPWRAFRASCRRRSRVRTARPGGRR
jgi:hypothetical protein